jgi:acetyl-CoA acetyltransferase
MSPQGFGGANGMFALHTRLYMERYGATREDFGRFCIALRWNALRNPNALFKEELLNAPTDGSSLVGRTASVKFVEHGPGSQMPVFFLEND